MIPVPSGVRVWLAVGHTDMRRGMNSLAIQVQQGLKRDPHAGDLYVFRGRRGHLIKILWHDGIGMSLYAKRLERGRFIWPSPADGTVAITSAQLAYMLEGIDWRNPVRSWRPEAAGWSLPRRRPGLRQFNSGTSAPIAPWTQARATIRPVTTPDEIDALRAALAAERAARQQAEARASGAEAMVAHLKLLIAKMKREQFGQSSERGQRLIDQMELQLEELEANAGEDEVVIAPADITSVVSFTRRKPVRAPLPAHLPRERVVVPTPSTCPCCGGKLAKLGEDITETLEVVPRQWKVIQTIREKFTCRRCETITQPPAPFHPIARARAGASLLAMILYAKFGEHQPLNRQSASYAREGIELDTSTLADWVGACTATLMPLFELIRCHVFAAERVHGDDTTVPVLAKNKTATARLWTYVRDDRPFGGPGPPAAIFYYSRNRNGEHPARHLAGYAEILQADAYAGFGDLYNGKRRPGPIIEAACWAHGRRNFFELADLKKAPLAIEAVRRIDAIFAIERELNGRAADNRRAARQNQVAPLVDELADWMRAERGRLSRHAETAKAIDYMLKRWTAFTRFLDDGRICLTNNAAERALRGIALGRKAWLFAGSDRGGERAAAIYTLIGTAKLNDVDPQAWLADVLRRINDHPASRLDELLPWNWQEPAPSRIEAA